MQALWMRVFPPTHTWLLLLMTLFTASTAFLVYRSVAKCSTETLGALAGLVLMALPLTQRYSSEVMAEAPLALFSFVAMLAMVRVLDRPTWRAAIWFGLAASLAILTKSSAWVLGITPLVAVVLIRRWKIITNARWLVSGGMVLALCVPFYVWTRQMAFAGAEGRAVTLARTGGGLWHLIGLLPEILGVALLLLAGLGLCIKVMLPLRRAAVEPYWAAMAAYSATVFVFHAAAPTTAEPRKIFMALPALVLFSFAGLAWLEQKWRWTGRLGALGVLAFLTVQTFYAHPAHCDAFGDPVWALRSHAELDQAVALVSASHPGGEGAFIAEVAQREPRPLRILLRATKLLASSTWNVLDYKLRYKTPDEVMAALESIPVRVIVLDSRPGGAYPHHELLVRALRQYAADWELIYSGVGCAESLEIYVLKKNVEGAPGRIQIDLRDKINRVLDYQVPMH